MKVVSVKTQFVISNLQKRSVRLDIKAMDDAKTVYDIEVQRASGGAGRKRARHNLSMLDASYLKPQQKVEDLHETYVIFICETDVLKRGKPLYRIERCLIEDDGTATPFGDGSHIIYVNGEIKDGDTPLGRLMYDFSCTDPQKMHNRVLAERVNHFKNTEKGAAKMSKIMEKLCQDSKIEGKIEGQTKMVQNLMESLGKTAREVMAMTGLSEAEQRDIEIRLS